MTPSVIYWTFPTLSACEPAILSCCILLISHNDVSCTLRNAQFFKGDSNLQFKALSWWLCKGLEKTESLGMVCSLCGRVGDYDCTYQVTDRGAENSGEGEHWRTALDHSEKWKRKEEVKQKWAINRYVKKQFECNLQISNMLLTSLFSISLYSYSNITDASNAFRRDTQTHAQHTLQCNQSPPCSHFSSYLASAEF